MTYTQPAFWLIVVLTLSFAGCESKDCCVPPPSLCQRAVVVDADRYNDDTPAVSAIDTAYINSDGCLTIRYGASGCDVNDAIVTLVDAGSIAESLPPQRNAKLVLVESTICQAFFIHEMTFDISEVLVDGEDFIYNFYGHDEGILIKK